LRLWLSGGVARQLPKYPAKEHPDSVTNQRDQEEDETKYKETFHTSLLLNRSGRFQRALASEEQVAGRGFRFAKGIASY